MPNPDSNTNLSPTTPPQSVANIQATSPAKTTTPPTTIPTPTPTQTVTTSTSASTSSLPPATTQTTKPEQIVIKTSFAGPSQEVGAVEWYNSSVWLGSTEYLYRYLINGELINFKAAPGNPPSGLAADRNNNFWFVEWTQAGNRIVKADSTGKTLSKFFLPGGWLAAYTGLDYDGESLWILSEKGDLIKMDPNTSQQKIVLKPFSNVGALGGIAWDPNTRTHLIVALEPAFFGKNWGVFQIATDGIILGAIGIPVDISPQGDVGWDEKSNSLWLFNSKDKRIYQLYVPPSLLKQPPVSVTPATTETEPGPAITVKPGDLTKTKITFTSNRDGNKEIYVISPDGSNQTQLTNNLSSKYIYWDYTPTWSPDGTKIIYTYKGNIYIMDSNGSNQTKLAITLDLTGSFSCFFPAWSPDSSQIVFTAINNYLDSYILVINADGSNQKRIHDGGWNASWSPDGTKIIFTDEVYFKDSTAGNPIIHESIFSMNKNGSGVNRLTTSESLNAFPSYSPDGKKIVFSSNRDGNSEIYIMNSDGSEQTPITNNSFEDIHPCWSPDGTKIAFSSNRDGNYEIYVMNTDGSGQTRLTNNPADDVEPAWSPILK
jgi:Tol biopolymer transport system component